jgi:superkiller protein 3
MKKTTFILLLFCLALTGCGTKKIDVSPTLKYGNPEYESVKDVPSVKYKDTYGKKSLPKLTGNEYEALGDALLSRKEYYMAYLQYEKCLEDQNTNNRIEYKKGLALLGGGKPEEAMKQFSMVIDTDPDFALAYEGLGRTNLKMKNYVSAKHNFQKAIGLDPLLWRSNNYLGNIFDITGNTKKAIKEYKIAVTIKPDAGFVYNNLGLSLSKVGKNKEAVKAFYKALNNGYTPKKTYNNLGMAFAELELYDDALEAFKKGGPLAVAYNNLGVGYMKNKDFKNAETCFKKAIEFSPRFYVLANENLKKCLENKK